MGISIEKWYTPGNKSSFTTRSLEMAEFIMLTLTILFGFLYLKFSSLSEKIEKSANFHIAAREINYYFATRYIYQFAKRLEDQIFTSYYDQAIIEIRSGSFNPVRSLDNKFKELIDLYLDLKSKYFYSKYLFIGSAIASVLAFALR